jgi:uncharacterized protein YcaQ
MSRGTRRGIPVPTVPIAAVRRLFLGTQGLLADPGRSAGRGAVQKMIEHMGFVQLDSINAVERAHHLILASRLDASAFERLVIATPKEIAGFWKAITPARAKQWCQDAARTGRLIPVLTPSPKGPQQRSSFALADWEQRLGKLPDPPERKRLLCPSTRWWVSADGSASTITSRFSCPKPSGNTATTLCLS